MTIAARVVLDTNVVVSAMLWQGKPGRLIELAGEGEIRLFASRTLLAELEATLDKPKLARSVSATGSTVETLRTNYRTLVTLVRPRPLQIRVSRDADDDHVIACALAARAKYIVTDDDDLLTIREIGSAMILSVSDMLAKTA